MGNTFEMPRRVLQDVLYTVHGVMVRPTKAMTEPPLLLYHPEFFLQVQFDER